MYSKPTIPDKTCSWSEYERERTLDQHWPVSKAKRWLWRTLEHHWPVCKAKRWSWRTLEHHWPFCKAKRWSWWTLEHHWPVCVMKGTIGQLAKRWSWRTLEHHWPVCKAKRWSWRTLEHHWPVCKAKRKGDPERTLRNYSVRLYYMTLSRSNKNWIFWRNKLKNINETNSSERLK